MKKIIIGLLLLTSCRSFSQICSLRNVCVWGTSSDTVTIGDSAYVDIKYAATSSYNNTFVWFQVSGNLNVVAKYTFTQLDSIPKIGAMPQDQGITRIKFVIPLDVTDGATYYYVSYRCHCQDPTPVYIKRPPVGINGYVKDNKIKEIRYYNLSGQEINKPNEGLYISNTIYSDGNILREKKFIK